MGVKTVINLRMFHDGREAAARAGLHYERIPMNAWHAEEAEADRFLRIVADKSRGPFFVHCYQGSDRTGMMCALYRIRVEGWTTDEAIAEMTGGGFGFHPIWQNLIKFLRKTRTEEATANAPGNAILVS